MLFILFLSWQNNNIIMNNSSNAIFYKKKNQTANNSFKQKYFSSQTLSSIYNDNTESEQETTSKTYETTSNICKVDVMDNYVNNKKSNICEKVLDLNYEKISNELINGMKYYEKYNLYSIIHDCYFISSFVYTIFILLNNNSAINAFPELSQNIFSIAENYKNIINIDISENKFICDQTTLNYKKIYDVFNQSLINVKNDLINLFNANVNVKIQIVKSNKFLHKFDENYDITTIIEYLINAIDRYYEYNKIINLLFNEQFYLCISSMLKCHDKKDDNSQIIIVNKIEKFFKNNVFIDPNYINEYHNNSLFQYIITITKYDYPLIIKKLIDVGYVINDYYDLIWSVLLNKMFGLTELFINLAPVDVLNQEYDGKTLFMTIIFEKHICPEKKSDILKIMIEKQVDVATFTTIHPLMKLDDYETNQIFDILINSNQIKNNMSGYDLITAIKHNKQKILKHLLQIDNIDINGSYDNQIPLFVCIDVVNESKKYEILELFLEFNPNIEIKNLNNVSPLMYSLHLNNQDIALILLKNNANPTIIDENGNNSLMYAVINGYNKMICEIIDKYENVINIKNHDGNTALFLITKSKCPISVCRELQISKDLDYNEINNFGYNIIDKIIESQIEIEIKEKLCEMLIKNVKIAETNSLNTIPNIIRATNNNLTNIVKMLLIELVKREEIVVTEGNLLKFLEGKTSDIKFDVKNTDVQNFYPLVTMFLKNNCKNKCNKNKNNDDSNKKKILIIIVMTIIMKMINKRQKINC